jgi:tight adherence protein B
VIVVGVAIVAGSVGWFIRRARIGARARSVGGTRLRLVARIGSELTRETAARAAVGGLGGYVFGGLVPAVLGFGIGIAWGPVMRVRAARRERDRLTAQLPDLLRALASALRAGRNLPQALEAACEDATPPLRDALDAATGHLLVGGSMDEALDLFEARARTPDASIVVETLRIGRAAGSNLPAILDVAVSAMAEREQIARDRRAASAQAKVSAGVVASMPAAFFLLVGSGARAQFEFLFRDPIGWGLLGAGLLLETGGALWMRALLRPR